MRLTVPGEIVKNWYVDMLKWCQLCLLFFLKTIKDLKIANYSDLSVFNDDTVQKDLEPKKKAFSAIFVNYKGQESASMATFSNCSPGRNAMLIEAATLYHNMREKCKRKSGQVGLPVVFAKVEEFSFKCIQSEIQSELVSRTVNLLIVFKSPVLHSP